MSENERINGIINAAIECRRWKATRDEILTALKGDTIAISNNFKQVERMRQREREEP